MTKPKIFFIPTYVAPLRHYARLIPYLEDKYDVGFLFVYKDSPRRQEAIDCCKEKNYTFYIIDEGLNEDRGIRLPFFTPLKKRYKHSISCRNFLETVKPAKIISHKAGPPYDTIFKEANLKGVETIVLQWSSAASVIGTNIRNYSLSRRVYNFILELLYRLLDLFYKEPRFQCIPAIPKKIGVFNQEKAEYYVKEGYDSSTIEIVGSIDFQLLHELKKKIDSNNTFREKLLEKYIIDTRKLKIMVILYRFYFAPEEYKMTIEEHVAHYFKMFKLIREVFPEQDAEIFLKMHPTENTMQKIYEKYGDLGVKLFFGDSKTDELLCLSDLYIADPTSSVNYMVLGSGTPAIFVNLSNFKALNEKIKFFNIKQVITGENDFIDKLKEFKNGLLEKQYDNTNIELKSIDKTIEFINK